MIYIFFILKFKSQLRRTRPDIVRQIDESLSRSIIDAGGKITGDRSVISAVLKEDSIGFWLDIYILIENLRKNIESSPEFFGYSLVIGSKMPNTPELLCRFLANHGGIFVDEKAAKKLLPYAYFEKPFEWLREIKKRKYGCGGYYRIKDLKIFRLNNENDFDINKNVTEQFEMLKGENVLMLGAQNLQMREGLNKYYNNLNWDFPPLTICFESIGIGAVIDIWSLNIRSLGTGELKDEIDGLWEFLFRERIQDEVSGYVKRCIRRFLYLVFDYYIDISRKRYKTPVLALENVHLAECNTLNLLIDVLSEVVNANRQKLLIFGIAENTITFSSLEKLESIFNKIIKIDDIKQNILVPKLSSELWEIVYAVALFNRYFSPELFLRLFEEENKNPLMVTKALSILYSLRIIDSVKEPRLFNRQFEEVACKILEDKAARIKTLVRDRLINWVVRRNINPCFRLLSIIANLDGVKQIDDMLLLQALTFDIVNKTFSTIETAMNNGQFDDFFSAKAAVIRHVYRTSRALNTEGENDIERIFNDTKKDQAEFNFNDYPVLNTQILVNFCGFYLGRREEKEAAEKAKEAISLGQNKNLFCLPQAYRLFSLVSLPKQKINESIEYLGFALTNAEKAGNNHETAISAYYAAAVQFLYGDIYHAAHLAKKSIEQSLAAGHPDWADRSRFLEGRLEFELGHYSKAHEIFENMKKDPYGSMTDEKNNLLAAWVYRAKIYYQDPTIPKPEGSHHDADLFEIEAAYLSGEFIKVLELSASYVNPFIKDNFLYTEKADWYSGFAQCEHLYFRYGEIQSRMISLFNSLALGCLPEQDIPKELIKNKEDPVQIIQKILRDEKLCEMDPWDSFYFYAKYRILEQTGASLVDLSTAVSMAFKRLQRRAGRIEDIDTRRQYLNGSRWNHELSLAAKEYKLI